MSSTKMKSKQEVRAEMVAVSDDAQASSPATGTEWLSPGNWAIFVTAEAIYYGKIVAITPTYYFLSESCWIPDTGRRHTFVADPSTANEVEFIGDQALERPIVSIERPVKPMRLQTK